MALESGCSNAETANVEIWRKVPNGETMGDDGLVLEVTIDRLPSGNFNMLNKRGYLICRVVDGSKLAEFIEKQFENKTVSFTLTMQLEKP